MLVRFCDCTKWSASVISGLCIVLICILLAVLNRVVMYHRIVAWVRHQGGCRYPSQDSIISGMFVCDKCDRWSK